MPTYRAYQVSAARQFELVERELTDPEPGHVRIRVEACGVCHSDALGVEAIIRPDPTQPVVPGHEIVGRIDAVGAGITEWKAGDRVGVGFLGGHCGQCESCRRGDFVTCSQQHQVGVTTDGGYAEYVQARGTGLVRVPESFNAVDAAPLLCAGLTMFSALRQTGARPGSLVAIQGIGGLGHLGIQYAAKQGYQVVAIARGTEKEELSRSLGATHYIDSLTQDPGAALQDLGGATAIVATGASGASMGPLVGGLTPRGQMIVVGLGFDPIPVQIPDLMLGGRSITGSLTGTPVENEDNLAFSLAQNVRPLTEVVPLDEAPKAYARMMEGDARFRIVLEIGH